MSEGMKKIEEAIDEIELPTDAEQEVIEAVMKMLGVIVEMHNGFDLRSTMETPKHIYTLSFDRRDR